MAVTESNERASVPAILADLIMVGQLGKLPDPIGMDASSNWFVELDFATRDDLDAWNVALGPATRVSSQPSHRAGHTLHNAWGRDRLGWTVNLTAVTADSGDHTELPAETLVALEHIASAS